MQKTYAGTPPPDQCCPTSPNNCLEMHWESPDVWESGIRATSVVNWSCGNLFLHTTALHKRQLHVQTLQSLTRASSATTRFRSRSWARPLKSAPHRGMGNTCVWIHSTKSSRDRIPLECYASSAIARFKSGSWARPLKSALHRGMENPCVWIRSAKSSRDRIPLECYASRNAGRRTSCCSRPCCLSL